MVLHVPCRLKMPDAIPKSRKVLLRSISALSRFIFTLSRFQFILHQSIDHSRSTWCIHQEGTRPVIIPPFLHNHHINVDKYSNIYKELPSGRRMRMKLNSGNKLERIFLLSWSTQHPYQAFWSLQTMDHQNLKQSAGKEQNVFYK